MEDIVSFISSVGFPIAMCFLLWWDSKTTLNKNTDAINQVISSLSKLDNNLSLNTDTLLLLLSKSQKGD